jgi:hypothetical protein
MTHPAEATGGHPDEMVPVPVHGVVSITETVPTEARAADFGAWSTYSVPASAFTVEILPYDEGRARALIIVSGTGPVYVGTKAQCQANPPVAGLLPTGAVVEVRNKRGLTLAGDGTHTATVTVLLERWES